MKLIKFKNDIYKEKWGIVKNDRIQILKEPPFTKINPTNKTISLKEIHFLPPTNSGKIILVGLNYQDHAKELQMEIPKNPIIFLKPTTTLIGHNANIVYPNTVQRLDYEAELAVVIKKKAKNIPRENVEDYILGYTCLNDVTARGIQKSDKQWTRAKSFDSFCPLGPWIETEVNPTDLGIYSRLNKEIKQNSSTSNFIFSTNKLLSFISGVMTLYPGDVISTGTPAGVGEMKTNDTIEVEVENIGKLKNFVVTEN